MQRYLHEHFLSKDHDGLINDVEINFVDKTDPSDPTRKEEFQRTKLKTLAPYGLNVEECHLSGSFKFAHFNYLAMYYVRKCQFLNKFYFDKALKNKNNVCISSPFLKVIHYLVCLSVAAFE